MKKYKLTYYLIFLFAFIAEFGIAQQEQLYTQFMYHKQEFNPAATANKDRLSAQLSFRSQWLGLDGAPTTQTLSVAMPLQDDRAGVGLSLIRHTIGITKRFTAIASYKYGFEIGTGKLAIGIDAQYRNMAMDFTDSRLVATQGFEIDPSIQRQNVSSSFFNLGTGIYYQNEKYYLSFSIPRILNNDIELDEEANIKFQEARHMYFMGGYEFKINNMVQIIPQLFVKIADNSPINSDININAWYDDKILAGITYRTYRSENAGGPQSINVLAGIKVKENYLLSFSYDIPINELRSYQGGSIEFNFGYLPSLKAKKKYVNPRFL